MLTNIAREQVHFTEYVNPVTDSVTLNLLCETKNQVSLKSHQIISLNPLSETGPRGTQTRRQQSRTSSYSAFFFFNQNLQKHCGSPVCTLTGAHVLILHQHSG